MIPRLSNRLREKRREKGGTIGDIQESLRVVEGQAARKGKGAEGGGGQARHIRGLAAGRLRIE